MILFLFNSVLFKFVMSIFFCVVSVVEEELDVDFFDARFVSSVIFYSSVFKIFCFVVVIIFVLFLLIL